MLIYFHILEEEAIMKITKIYVCDKCRYTYMNYFRNFFQSLITKIDNITYLIDLGPDHVKVSSNYILRLTNKIANYEKSIVDCLFCILQLNLLKAHD